MGVSIWLVLIALFDNFNGCFIAYLVYHDVSLKKRSLNDREQFSKNIVMLILSLITSGVLDIIGLIFYIWGAMIPVTDTNTLQTSKCLRVIGATQLSFHIVSFAKTFLEIRKLKFSKEILQKDMDRINHTLVLESK